MFVLSRRCAILAAIVTYLCCFSCTGQQVPVVTSATALSGSLVAVVTSNSENLLSIYNVSSCSAATVFAVQNQSASVTCLGSLVSQPPIALGQILFVFGIDGILIVDVDDLRVVACVTVCNASLSDALGYNKMSLTAPPRVVEDGVLIVTCAAWDNTFGLPSANVFVVDAASRTVYFDGASLVSPNGASATPTGFGGVVRAYAPHRPTGRLRWLVALVTDTGELSGFLVSAPNSSSDVSFPRSPRSAFLVALVVDVLATHLWTTPPGTVDTVLSAPVAATPDAEELLVMCFLSVDGFPAIGVVRLTLAQGNVTATFVLRGVLPSMTVEAMRLLPFHHPLPANARRMPSIVAIMFSQMVSRFSGSTFGQLLPPENGDPVSATGGLETKSAVPLDFANALVGFRIHEGNIPPTPVSVVVVDVLTGRLAWEYPAVSNGSSSSSASAASLPESSGSASVSQPYALSLPTWTDGVCLLAFLSYTNNSVFVVNLFTGDLVHSVTPVPDSNNSALAWFTPLASRNNGSARTLTIAMVDTQGNLSLATVPLPNCSMFRFPDSDGIPREGLVSWTVTPEATASTYCSTFDNISSCNGAPEGTCQWCSTLGGYCTDHKDCYATCFDVDARDASFPYQCQVGECQRCLGHNGLPYCAATCNCFDLSPASGDCTPTVLSDSQGSCAFCVAFGYCANATTGGDIAAQCSCSALPERECESAFGHVCRYGSSGCTYGPCFSFLVRGYTAQPYFLFLVAVLKDLVALMFVNAIGSVVARWIGVARHRCFRSHRLLPLSELALERPTQFTVEETKSISSLAFSDEATETSEILRSRTDTDDPGAYDVGRINLTSRDTYRTWRPAPQPVLPSSLRRPPLPLSPRYTVEDEDHPAVSVNGAPQRYSPRGTAQSKDTSSAAREEEPPNSHSGKAPAGQEGASATSFATSTGGTLRRLLDEEGEWQNCGEDGPLDGVVNYEPEMYCREVLMPLLFDVSSLSPAERRCQGERLLAYLLADDLWISAHKLLEDDGQLRRSFAASRSNPNTPRGVRPRLEAMDDVIRSVATDSVIVYTSLHVKGRIGHTLDTYLGTFVLWILVVFEFLTWSVYIADVIVNDSQELTLFECFQVLVFRVANSGAVTSLSLLLVKYFDCLRVAHPGWWRICSVQSEDDGSHESQRLFSGTLSGQLPAAAAGGAPSSQRRSGDDGFVDDARDIPPVASATRARFRHTKKVHLLTGLYVLIQVPMILTGLCGVVLYPFIPILFITLGLAVRTLSQRAVWRMRASHSRWIRRHPVYTALFRFIVEQQLLAVTLAISLQTGVNYAVLFLHRNLYELNYWTVISKEFYSRSTECFVIELQQDFQNIFHQGGSLLQWLTAMLPGG